MKRSCKSVLLVGMLFLALAGCRIYDNMEDCSQGIDVRFYSKTSCSSDTIYPDAVRDLRLYVFDKNDRLVSYQANSAVEMQPIFHQTVEAKNGLFTVVAWAGLASGPYDLPIPEIQVTTKGDLLFRLQREVQKATSIDGRRMYYGESPAVFLPDPAEYGSVFESTSVNLKEITNRFSIQVEGLPQAEDYEVVIESANGSMNIDGSIASDEIIQYPSQPSVKGGILEATFTLLKLETGRNSTLIIRDKRNGNELFRGDLLGTLLLKNPEINLACDHDFAVRFTAQDQCTCGTYMIVKIWVNEWLVHSYATDL
ncbi:hypothetical protein FACS1894182_03520 [Bacteroidia bacterium]|nr:hypothetical protein FACS1894182_03520 [Bacteroidia bacterium]